MGVVVDNASVVFFLSFQSQCTLYNRVITVPRTTNLLRSAGRLRNNWLHLASLHATVHVPRKMRLVLVRCK